MASSNFSVRKENNVESFEENLKFFVRVESLNKALLKTKLHTQMIPTLKKISLIFCLENSLLLKPIEVNNFNFTINCFKTNWISCSYRTDFISSYSPLRNYTEEVLRTALYTQLLVTFGSFKSHLLNLDLIVNQISRGQNNFHQDCLALVCKESDSYKTVWIHHVVGARIMCVQSLLLSR